MQPSGGSRAGMRLWVCLDPDPERGTTTVTDVEDIDEARLMQPPMSMVVVYAFDARGVCTLAKNTGVLQGLTPQEILGKSLLELYARQPAVIANIERVLGGQRVRNITVVDGRELDTFIEPEFGPDGEVVGAFGMAVDVTEARANERMLADMAERDRALAEMSARLAEDTADIDRVVEDAARLVAKFLGGYVAVWTLTETGALKLGAAWHRDLHKRALIEGLLSRLDLSTPLMFAQAALTHGRADAIGSAELMARLPEDARPLQSETGVETIAHAPIKAAGATLGVLAVYREPEHGAFTASELILLAEVAGRIGMALANARLLADLVAEEKRVRQLAEQRQSLLARQVAVVEAERARIAADVHDDSIQVLAAVDLRLGLLRRRLQTDAPAHLDFLDRLHRDIQEAVSRLRALLFDLEAPARDHALADALRQLATQALQDSDVEWIVDDTTSSTPSETVRTVAYRICQEALANVRRHAGARRVRLALSDSDGGLLLTVTDDGRGMGSEATESRLGHLGLGGMRERAETAGGHWHIESRPGEGTTVSAWLPLHDRD